jgi:hypothetical protein
LPPADTPVPEATVPEAAAPEAAATDKGDATVPFTKSGQDLGDTRTFGVVIADIDQDGDNDIFIANYIGPSAFWLNDGHGTFSQSRQKFDVSEVHGAAIQDLNGDAYPDIFLLNHATPSKVYFNDGAGNFTDSGQNIGSAGDAPGMIILGDVDGDGDQDAFISYFNAPNRLWLNDGSGVFVVTETEYGGRGKSYEMVLDDFNGDTFPDLFLSMSDQPDEVWLNDGLGNLANSGQALGSDRGDDHPDRGDVDGDGDQDVVVANSAEGVKVWLNQDNTGMFVEAGPYWGADVTGCGLLDADLDGDPDLIVARLENGSQLWLNDGSGVFTPVERLIGDVRVLSLASGDLDGDGDDDLVFGALERTGGNAIYFNEAKPATASITGDSWFKTYGGNQNDVANDVVPSGDGGFFIVGVTNLEFEPEQRGDVYLIKTNAAGEILWEKTYGGEGYAAGATLFQTGDGTLLISGSTRSPGAGDLDIFVMEVDRDGNELWSKTFGGPLDEVGAAWPLDDGGYLLGGNRVDPNDLVVDDPGVAGYAGFAGRSNVYLARIDAEGNERWSRTFGGENNVLAMSALPAADGGFVILATIMYFPENDDDIYLLKVDADGNEVWSRTWNQGMSSGYGLVGTPDGNYLVTGPYSPPEEMDRSTRDFLFVQFDAQGNEVWTSTFGDPEIIDYAQVLAATADGGYVAAGGAERDLTTWDADIVIVKIDERGQPLWQQTVETGTHSMFGGILEHPGGGYVVAGSIFNGQNFDVFLLKTDASGNVTAPAEPAGLAEE